MIDNNQFFTIKMGGDKKHKNIHEKKTSPPHKSQPVGQNIHEDVQNSSTSFGKTKKHQGVQPPATHEKPIIH